MLILAIISAYCLGIVGLKPASRSGDGHTLQIRVVAPSGGFSNGSIAYYDSLKHEMWRFVIPGQVIAKYLPSFIEFPPMQAGGSFNVSDLKEKVEEAQKAALANSQ